MEEDGCSQGSGDNTVLLDLEALLVGAREQTEYVQHKPASTSNNVEALAKGGEEERRVSVEEHACSGEEGRSWDASREAVMILGVESDGEENLFHPKA